jgi:hypothetical protein
MAAARSWNRAAARSVDREQRRIPVEVRCSTCSYRSDAGIFLEGEKQVDAATYSDRTLLTSGLPHV